MCATDIDIKSPEWNLHSRDLTSIIIIIVKTNGS